ncbi:hypothetical protein pb186bvf_016923 [Paramecium bursaria]
MIIQILFIIESTLALDCTKVIGSVVKTTAVANQETFSKTGQIQIQFLGDTTSSSQAVTLTFPSVWTTSLINPLGGATPRCYISSDPSTQVAHASGIFSFTVINMDTTTTYTITCTNIWNPATWQDSGISLVSQTTCNTFKISTFLAYSSSSLSSSIKTPTILNPDTKRYVFTMSGFIPPLDLSAGYVELTMLNTNLQARSDSYYFGASFYPQKSQTTTVVSFNIDTAGFVKDTSQTITIGYFNVMGTTQTQQIQFTLKDSTDVIKYSILLSFPVSPGLLTINTVSVNSQVINAFTLYKFTITLTNAIDSTSGVGQIYVQVPDGSLGTSLKTICNGNTYTNTVVTTSPQYAIATGCSFSTLSPAFDLDSIKNPSSTQSSIQITQIQSYSNGYLVDQSTTTFDLKTTQPLINDVLTSATITRVDITTASQIVGGQSYLSFNIVVKNAVPINGFVILSIPSSQINFITTGTFTCSSPCTSITIAAQQAMIQLSQAYSAGATIAYQITQSAIQNPYDLSPITGSTTISTANVISSFLIDQGTGLAISGFPLSQTSSITINTFTQSGTGSRQNGGLPAYQLSFTTVTPQIVPFTIQVSVGSLTLQTTISCTYTSSQALLTFAACTASGSSIQIEVTSSLTLLSAGTQITINVGSGSIKNLDSFIIGSNWQLTTISKIPQKSMSSQSIPVVANNVEGSISATSLTITPNSFYGATNLNYAFSFTLANSLQTDSIILINCPFTIFSTTVTSLTCTDQYNTLLSCVQGSNANQIKITGGFTTGVTQSITIQGMSTPATSSASLTFSLLTYRFISGVQYPSDKSSATAFTFTTTCPTTNNCKSCTGAATPNPTCTSCYSVSINSNIYLKNGICVAVCGDGYFQNDLQITTQQYQCISCPSNCKTCSQTLVCSQCSGGFYLLNSNCVANCAQNGFYLKSSTDISCSTCNTNCISCTTTSTFCQSCISGVPYRDNACYPNGCGTGYYKGTLNGVLICGACQNNCIECASSASCTQCATGYYSSAGGCFNPCPDQFFNNKDTSGTLICSSCITGCKTCSNSTSCIECSTGFLLQGSICVTTCGNTFYASSNTTCSSCGNLCATCAMANSTLTCSACQTGAFKFDVTNCVSTCPGGYFQSSQTACTQCDKTCATCSNTAGNCITCPQNASPALYLQGSACTSTCDVGSFPDTSTGSCISCATNCLTCTNAQICTKCSQASSILYLYQGSCRTSCPQGFQASNSTCVTIPTVIENPARFIPIPFTIFTSFFTLCVGISKYHKHETFIPGSLVGLNSFPEWGSWIALGLLYYLYKSVQAYQFYLLAGGIFSCYVLNFIQIFLIKRIYYPDPQFQLWMSVSIKNRITHGAVLIFSIFGSFRTQRLIISRFFGFSFFKARLQDTKELFQMNLCSGISLIVVSVPILIASAVIAYDEPTFDTQIFISAIDTFIVTFFNLLFVLWETQKDEHFFDETAANFYSLNVTNIIQRNEDSGYMNNTFNKKLVDQSRIEDQKDEILVSARNKNQSENISKHNISHLLSDRVSMGRKDTSRVEGFPKSESARPEIWNNSKRTIYAYQARHIVRVDEESFGSDPDQEPQKADVDRSIYSSVRSQKSEHGNNPMNQSQSPIKDISIIKGDSDDEDGANPDDSQLSIFKNTNTVFNVQQSTIKKGEPVQDLRKSIIIQQFEDFDDEEKVHPSQVYNQNTNNLENNQNIRNQSQHPSQQFQNLSQSQLQQRYNNSQVGQSQNFNQQSNPSQSNKQMKLSKQQSNQQNSIQQTQPNVNVSPQIAKQQTQEQINAERINTPEQQRQKIKEQLQIDIDNDDNISIQQPNSRNSLLQHHNLEPEPQNFIEQKMSQSQSSVPIKNESQSINSQNPFDHAANSQNQLNKGMMASTHTNKTQQSKVMDLNIIPPGAFKPKSKKSSVADKEPSYREDCLVEQMQLEIENIDQIPDFDQQSKTVPLKQTKVRKIQIENNNYLEDKDQFEIDDQPIAFNEDRQTKMRQSQDSQAFDIPRQYKQVVPRNQQIKQPKPYATKLTKQDLKPQVDKLFDFDESIHSDSDQDWIQNQNKPSEQFNNNMGYEDEPNYSNLPPAVPSRQVQRNIPIIETLSQVDGSGLSDVEKHGNMFQEFSKNHNQNQPSQRQKQLNQTYLQRNNVPRPNKKTGKKSQRNNQKDVTDAYFESKIDIEDVDF